MPHKFQITTHPSQSPDEEQRALARQLNRGMLDPRLLYQSKLQSERWLKVAQRWAPFVNSSDCRSVYLLSGRHVAERLEDMVAIVALGCGDGRKDRDLLRTLNRGGTQIQFVPLDVSADLVCRAAQNAAAFVPSTNIHPIVADLQRSDGLSGWLDDRVGANRQRVFTFFGMIPNFYPRKILPVLRNLLKVGDLLMFSANLVSGEGENDLLAILPQYDNEETRAWLLTVLEETGASVDPARLCFSTESDEHFPSIRRIVADYEFGEPSVCNLVNESIQFDAGSTLRLFFSYRYSENQINELLAQYGLIVEQSWVTQNQQEGVFICRRSENIPHLPDTEGS